MRYSPLLASTLILLSSLLLLPYTFQTAKALPSISQVRTWGGSGNEFGYGTAIDSGGNVYVGGETSSFGGGTGTHVFLLKYDTSANILWQRTWGGTGYDLGLGVAVSSGGHVYVTGATTSFGAGGSLYGDAFLLQYDSSGNVVWQKTWGSTGDDLGNGVTTDSSGNIYVTGGYNFSPTGKAFLLKFDSTGALTWQVTWGGSAEDQAQAVATDSSGNIYVTGLTNSFGAGAGDVFLLKFNSAGSLLWQRTWGGIGYEIGTGVAVDSSGNAYVTGQTESYGFGGICGTTPNTYKCPNLFLLKFDPTGSITWSRSWGTNSGDAGQAVAVDSSGDAFVTGVHIAINDDVILLKFAPNGVLLQQVQWGGSGYEYGQGVTVDSSGNALVTGSASAPPYSFQYLSITPFTLSTTTSTPSGTTSNPSLTPSTPSGTVTTPTGSQTYAGGTDAFLLKYTGGANRRVTQTSDSMVLMQNEPSIAVNPTNPNNIIAGYNDFSQYATTGVPRPHYSYSTDGGNTWTAGANALATPAGDTHKLCCDTAVSFDSAGNAYIVTLDADFCYGCGGHNIIIYTSAPDANGNSGAAWGAPVIVNTGDTYTDKPAIAIDRTGGAHNGNIYVAWVSYTYDSVNKVWDLAIKMRTGTLVAGVPTFTTAPIVVSSGNDHWNWGPALAVGPSGSIYVSYFRMASGTVGLTANSITISRSDDGGGTLALTGQQVAAAAGPYCAFCDPRTSALPTIAIASDETIIVAWTDTGVGVGAGTGRMDIRSARSTNRGASWSTPVSVNNDPNYTNRDHFLPAATFAGTTLYIFFYDRRNDPANTDAFLYAAQSTDEGQTFPTNFAVSDTFSDAAVCSGTGAGGWSPCLWGDYIGATSYGGSILTGRQFYVVWGDSRDSLSAGDNDVNVYFETFGQGGLIVDGIAKWAWQASLRNLIFPTNGICQTYPQICQASIQAKILPINGFNGTVNLYSANLPPGVSVSFTPSSGVPPFNTKITVDARSASCSGVCDFSSTALVANSTDGDKPQSLHFTFSSKPFLLLNASAYKVGTNLTLTGRGFSPNMQVKLNLDGSTLASGQTDPTGSLQLSAMIPASTRNGQHTLNALDTSGNILANTTFIAFSGQIDPEIVPRTPPVPTLTPPAALISGMGTLFVTAIVALKRTHKQRVDNRFTRI